MAFSIIYWANYTENKPKLIRKSENSVESNHVLKFLFDSDTFHVRSVVQASMRDRSYRVEIDLDESSTVSRSSCECPLGDFMCHHVAATLLFGYKRASKTDVKCSWLKNPKTHLKPETQTMEDLFPPNKPEYRALDRPVSDSDRAFLYQKLSDLGRFTALHWMMSPEPVPADLNLLPVVEDLIISRDYLDADNPHTWLRKRFPVSLFKRLQSCYNLEAVKSVGWGIHHEATAVKSYSTKTGMLVEDTGIWMHESGVLGASPDGLIVKPDTTSLVTVKYHTEAAKHLVPKMMEVKCPYSCRDMTVSEAIGFVKGFCLVRDDMGNICVNENHDYWHQIQGQMYMQGNNCCDLVVWTTKSTEIVRVAREESWQENINKLIDFYFNRFLELITK